MEKAIVFVVAVLMVFGLWAGVMWCIWLFAGAWTLAGLVGRTIFGGRSKSKD